MWCKSISVSLIIIGFSIVPCFAIDTWFVGGNADTSWFNPANWNPSIPASSDFVNLNATATGSSGLPVCAKLQMGTTSGASAQLLLSGTSDFALGGALYAGYASGSNAKIDLKDQAKFQATGNLVFGRYGVTDVNVAGNSVVKGATIFAGNSANASFALNGGTVQSTGHFYGNYSNGCKTTMTVNSGTLTSGGSVLVGTYGIGNCTINGGTIIASQGFYIGYDYLGQGTVNMNDGSVTCNSLTVSNMGMGTLNMYDGSITVGTDVYVGYDAYGEGALNLHGGTIQAKGLVINDYSSVDLTSTSGRIILDGNDLDSVSTYIDDGKITAYGGSNPAIMPHADYDITNPGKTTIKLCPLSDRDGDCDVDFEDLRLFAEDWLINSDFVDYADLAAEWLY